MSLFKEIYGILKDTEEGERLGLDADTIRRLVDEDVIPRRYSKGPGVGYPSKEEEEEALALDSDLDNEADADMSMEEPTDAELSDTDLDAEMDIDVEPEGEDYDTDEELPEQILSYARELMDQGMSVEGAARQASEMIYDELVSVLQGGCEECPEDEMDSEDDYVGSEDEIGSEDDYDSEESYGSEEEFVPKV